jgi:hypothetical protein
MKEHGVGASTFADWAYKFEVNDAIPYKPIMHNVLVVAYNSDEMSEM